MLYDLNIPWTPSTSPAELQSIISFASSLGYSVLALNHTITPPFPSQIINPLPKIPSPPASQQTANGPPTILHRATVLLSDPAQNFRLPAVAAAYDVLAVRPTTERAFQAACLSMAEPSLISLDLAQHLGYHFRPKTLMAAVARGVRIEVCYSQVLAGDARARACFISNLGGVVRATKGRGIVVSSEAAAALSLRAPADVVNLLAVWGLDPGRGAEALGVNPRGVVVNEGVKRSGFRGVVNVLEVGGREGDDAKKKKQQQQQQQGGGKKQGESGGNGQKRKTPDESGDGAQPAISKRQAKKLRMAQKEKEKGSS